MFKKQQYTVNNSINDPFAKSFRLPTMSHRGISDIHLFRRAVRAKLFIYNYLYANQVVA